MPSPFCSSGEQLGNGFLASGKSVLQVFETCFVCLDSLCYGNLKYRIVSEDMGAGFFLWESVENATMFDFC